MTPDELRRVFAALASVGDADLSLLLQHTSRVEIPAGDNVIPTSEQNDSLFIILEGRVRISLESEDECSILGDLGPGQWIGELGMIQPALAVASVVAVEDCTLLRLQHDEFMALRGSSPTLTSIFLQMLCTDMAERLRSTIGFIDQEPADTRASEEIARKWMAETARKLIGIAARSGA